MVLEFVTNTGDFQANDLDHSQGNYGQQKNCDLSLSSEIRAHSFVLTFAELEGLMSIRYVN